MNDEDIIYTVEEKNEKTNNKYKILSFILAIMLFISVGFTAGVIFERNTNTTEIAQTEKIVESNTEKKNVSYADTVSVNNINNNSTSYSIADIVNLTSNSVVEIATETVVNGRYIRQYVAEGAGSGVIISEDGYIVTNNHVIEDATKIIVKLKNGEEYEAKLVGTDVDTDVSVLKIEATDLKPAVFGDSDMLQVGELAIAVGNPLGELGGTVTDGIISALDREIDLGDTIMNLLQTNAAINPGNSGGGLFNGRGELIGITVAKSSGTDVEGLGFAIPINDVKKCVEDIKTYGYVKGKIQLGLNLIEIDNVYDAMMYRVSSTGVYVQSVTDDSSAEKAGVEIGDRIIEFNGIEVDSYSTLKKAINKGEVGEIVEMVVVRNGREKILKIYLSEAKE